MNNFTTNSFPVQEGNINLEANAKLKGVAVCSEDGDIEVTWDSGNTDTISATAGQAFNLVEAKSGIVISGIWHTSTAEVYRRRRG